PDYIPLYIKLHGTAGEPESLRFTRDSYYDSPVGVGTTTAELFDTPECTVVNVGFGMGSFDLHRLLARPERLWLFDLSKVDLAAEVKEAITQERAERGRVKPEFRPKKSVADRPDSDVQVHALLKRVENRSKELL